MRSNPRAHIDQSVLRGWGGICMKIVIIPGLLVLLLVKLGGLFGSTAEKRADLIFIPRGDIKTLDLAKMSYMDDIRMANGLWEGLYTLDPVTLTPVLGSAYPIEISEDKKTYTFHIRPNARWSNGDPLLAADYLFGWKRIMDEQGEYSYLLNYMEGAETYQKAIEVKQKDPAVVPDFGVLRVETSKDDPRLLRVHLTNPTTFFPDLCAFPCFYPSHEKSMMEPDPDHPGAVRLNKKFTRPPFLVTNGPYRLDRWEFKRKLRLVASDYYWNRKNVKSRVIEMLVDDDQQNALSAYESGAADWITEIQGDFASQLRKMGRHDLKAFPAFGTYFYGFNCREKLPDGSTNPFHKIAVRRALTMAIEKQFIVDHLTRMGEPVATGYIPRGVFNGYVSPKGIEYDVKGAQKLLAEAGYPGGEGFPILKINFNLEEKRHKEIAEYIQREWKKNLNIEISLDGKELKTYGEQYRNKQYAVSRGSWYGDYNDISTFTDKYLPDSGNNESDWKNSDYAKLCDAATRETDDAKRRQLFHDAEQILVDEAPILPLFHYVNTYLFHDNVRGIPLNARQAIMLNAVEVNHP